MKRLLSLLGSITMVGMTATTVVSCQNNKTSIASIIAVNDLGAITMRGDYPDLGELIAAIRAKNPSASNLNSSNIRLLGQPRSTYARVMGIGAYTGTTYVTYTRGQGPSPVEKDLTKIITTTNLGPIVMASASGPTAAELLQGIKNANSKAANLTTSDFTATNVTGTSATVTGANGYTGTVNLTYTRQTSLSNIITTTNLGAITMANPSTGPTAAELLAGIKAKNPNAASLTTNDFTISGTATPTAATINGAGSYTGTSNLTYTAQTDLAKVIANASLGPIAILGSTPTLAELLVGIIAANPTTAAGLTAANISLVGTPTATSATVAGVSPFSGNVTLNYSKLLGFDVEPYTYVLK